MQDWKNSILSPSDTLRKAVSILDKEVYKIILVADKNNHLLGTITDGDIRRALLNHVKMTSPLIDVMFKKPVTASYKDTSVEILDMMNKYGIMQVPVLNKNGQVVDIKVAPHFEIPNKLDNPVFLMAGGFGKRLHPLTHDIPKPLLKVGDKPILETILLQLIGSGFFNFYISTHYKANMIREYFGDGSRWGVDIKYISENKPLGTAGALGLLPKKLPDAPLLMMNGDLLTTINFKNLLSFHEQHQEAVATMCVREYDFQVPYGVVNVEGSVVTGIEEKPVHSFFVNAGIYILNSSIVKEVAMNDYVDMPVLLEKQIKQQRKVNMFPIHEYWLDMGNIQDFEKASSDIKSIGINA